jgi:mono/diheme cytochrome c family protein
LVLVLAGCGDETPARAQAWPGGLFSTRAPVASAPPAALPTTRKAVRSGRRRHGDSIVRVRIGEHARLLVADADAHAIHVLNAEDDRPLGRLSLDGKPSSMVIGDDGRVYAALVDRAVIVVLEVADAASTTLRKVRELPAPSDPTGLVFTPDGKRLVVVSGWEAALVVLDVATGEERARVELAREPRAVALSPDGATAFVAHASASHISRVDLAATPPRATPLPLSGHDGHVSPKPQAGPDGRGVSTNKRADGPTREARQGFALAMADGWLFMPAVLVHTGVEPGSTYGSGAEGYPSHEATIAQLNLAEDVPLLRGLNRHFKATTNRSRYSAAPLSDDCKLPRAASVAPDGGSLWIACWGTDEVLVVSTRPGGTVTHALGRWTVPAGPSGIAFDEREAIVWSAHAGAIARLPLVEPLADDAPEILRYPKTLEAPVRVTELPREAGHDAQVAEGRRLFYAVGDPRISIDGRACASCHPDGRDDALNWPIAAGPRQTPILAGRLSAKLAPFGWQGDGPTVADHLHQTFGRLGGDGLPDAAVDALLAYLAVLPQPSSVARADDGAVARGRELFTSKTAACASCHGEDGHGSDGTRHDMGTGAAVDTPSLRFIAHSAPYFHDGRYASLSQLLRETSTTMGFTADLSDEDFEALEAYLRSL